MMGARWRRAFAPLALLLSLWSVAYAGDRLHLGDDVEVLQPQQAKTKLADTRVDFIGDQGNVSTYRLHGDYDRGLAAPRFEVARSFYEAHPDEFDFLIAFTGFEFPTEDALAFYNPVRNDVLGVGLEQFDHSAAYGSAGRLQGYIDMAALSRYDFNTRSQEFRSPLNTLSHEIMHRWSVRLRYADATGVPRSDLIGRGGAHWSLLASTQASIMYGARWQEIDPGRWSIVEVRQRLSTWDLYLAGLADISEVSDLTLIRSGDVATGDLPRVGLTVQGSGETISPAQIVAAEGRRVPAASESQRVFDAAVILLLRPDQTADPRDLARLERFRGAFEQYFQSITQGRATIRLHLRGLSGARVAAPAPLLGSEVSPRPQPAHAAVNWLRSRQLGDGSWRDRPGSAARDTAAALSALVEFDATLPEVALARQWLATRTARNLDERAWLQMARPEQSVPGEAVPNPDGGFGLLARWRSSPVDAIRALAASSIAQQRDEAAIAQLASFVRLQQNADGSFGPTQLGAGRVAVSTTTAEQLMRREDPADRAAGARVRDWLKARLGARPLGDGLFSLAEVAELAQRAGSLDLPATTRAALVSHLLARQGEAGDWQGSIYTTATAALALMRESLPNLVPLALTAEPRSAVRGEPVRLRVRVGNPGGQPAAASSLRWYDAAPQAGGQPITALIPVRAMLAGDEVVADAWIETAAMAGARELFAAVDAAGDVEETRDDDNIASVMLDISPAPAGIDLGLESRDMEFVPGSFIRVPSTVRLSGRVRNYGTSPAAGVRVRAVHVLASGENVLAETSVDVGAASQGSFALDLPITLAQAHRIRVVADPDDTLSEARESNNTVELSLPFADAVDFELIGETLAFDAAPVLGNDTRVRVGIANRGTRDTPLSALVLERQIGEDWIRVTAAAVEIPAGQQVQRELVWRPQQEGLQNLRLRVDPDAAVAESDEENNRIAFTQEVIRNDAPSLQLVPDSITLDPFPVRQGRPLRLGVAVRNLGLGASAGFDVALYLGDPRVAGVRLGTARVGAGVAPQAQSSVQIDVAEFPEHGDLNLFVHVDSGHEVAESNEDDNYGIREVTALGLPDLTVSLGAFTLTPSAPSVGARVTARIEVSNVGEQPAAPVRMRLSELSGSARSEVSPLLAVPELAPGSSHVGTWEWTFGLVDGAQALSVEVDPDNQLRERDEGNNEVTRLLETQSGEFFVTEPYFSPNGDGVKDQVRAVFTLGAGIERVSVVDHAGRERRSLDSLDGAGAGAVGVIWDGRDQAGRVLNDGRYGLLALSANGEAQGPVYVTLDTDRPMALEAVSSENGVHRALPASMHPWIELPQGSPGEDYLYAVGHASNALNQFKRGVVRTHALLGGAEPVLTPRWLDRYAQDNGLISIEPVQVDFLADGRLLIAMHEFGGGNRTLVFAMGANEIDKPVLVGGVATRAVDPLLGRIDAQRVLVGARDSAELWDLDVGAGTATALRDPGYVSTFAALLPSGIVVSDQDGRNRRFLPFDANRPGRNLPTVGYEDSQRVSFLPGAHAYLEHVQRPACDSGGGGDERTVKEHGPDTDNEYVYLVDVRDGQRRLLHSTGTRNPGVTRCNEARRKYSREFNGAATLNSLRTFWLERQRVAIVVDHHAGQMLRFDAEGRSLGQSDLPKVLRQGEYAEPGDESSARILEVNPAESNYLHSICPVGAHASWLQLARSRLGFEHRSFNPDSDSLYLTSGEAVVGIIGNSSLIRCEGVIDYWKIGGDLPAQRLAGSSGWPLADAADAQAYPPTRVEAGRAVPPPEWPRFIHGNGTQLRSDGRIQIPHQGRLTAPWSFATQLVDTSLDETRLHLGAAGAADERTVALFSTLEKLTAVLTASSDERAIRLGGVALDRNFDHFRIDWALASAPDSWNALLPATSEMVRFDDFITWAPPQAGAYLFRLRVVDRAGNQRERYATAEVAFGAPIANVRQNYRAISPNGDSVQDRLELAFLVLRPTEQRFEVRDFAGRVVRREDRVYGVEELGAQAWNWDGRDDQGAPAPEGRYRIELSSGFVLRVDLDVTAPVVEAALTLPWDHYDRADLTLRNGDAPLVGLGPIIDYRVTDVFAGQTAVPQRRALESAALDQPSWTELQPAYLLHHEDGLLQAALSASQYVGRRFRVVASDAAGNRAQVAAGSSVPSLLLLHADELRDVLPSIQSRPYGRADDIPHYRFGSLTSSRLHGTPIHVGPQVPLFALDLAGGITEVSVDELQTAAIGGVPTWVTRKVAVPTPTDAGPLPNLAGHLSSVTLDLSSRNPGDQIALRLRARYSDNSERVSNALRFTAGGLELRCPGSQPFRATSYLQPTTTDYVLEVGDAAGRVLERVPSGSLEGWTLDGSAPELEGDAQFSTPNVSAIRARHGLSENAALLYRATALDGAGRAAASKWIPCDLGGPGGSSAAASVRVMPVFAAQCDARPSGRVLIEYSALTFEGEHRLAVYSPFLAQPYFRPEVFPASAGRMTTQLDVAGWPEAEYSATLERRLTPDLAWTAVARTSFVVDHRAPQAQIQTPVVGDRICANNPAQHQASILVRDARRIGWQLESRRLMPDARFEQFACGGYADARGQCELQDFETGAVRAITARTPLESLEALADEPGDEMVELRLRASDWSGAQVCDTVQVAVDGAVRLEERAAPLPVPRGTHWPLIAPASGGAYREALWSLLARERVQLSVTLHRAQRTATFSRAEFVGDSIATLASSQSVFGQHDFSWDGRIAGQPVVDGLYGVRFRALDDCGNEFELDRFVELDSTPPQIALTAPAEGAQLRAATVPISGQVSDAHLDRYSISISQTSAAGPWLGLVEGTRPVRVPEVLTQWSTAGAQGPVWIRLAAQDAVGNLAQLVRSIELLPRAAVLQEARLEPALFSPNSDGGLDEAVLLLTLRRAARLHVRVLDTQGALVRELASDLTAAEGNRVLVWDGRNQSGAVAADATYSIEVRAIDVATPESVDTQVLDLVLDTVAPALSAVQPGGAFANCETGVDFNVDDPHFLQVDSTLVRQGVTVVTHAGTATGYHLVTPLFGMSEGQYRHSIQARDAAANLTETSREFVLDCTAASARLDVLDGAVLPRVDGQLVEIRGTANDANLLRYVLDLAPVATPEQRVALAEGTAIVENGDLFRWQPTQPDGEYLLRLRVEDRAGNVALDEHRIRIDGTPPLADIDYPADGAAVTRRLYVAGRALDTNFHKYRLEFATPPQASRNEWSTVGEGDAPVNQSRLGSLELVHEGEVEVRLVVTDKAGLSSTDRIRVRVDGEPPPALTLSGNLDQRDVRLSWQGPEIADLGIVRIVRNGVEIARHTLATRNYIDRDVPEGELTYVVIAVDQAGNVGPPSNAVVLNVDRTPPDLALYAPTSGERIRASFLVSGAAHSDDLAGWELSVLSAQGDVEVLRRSPTPITGGPLHAWDTRAQANESGVRLRLTARDLSGNESRLEVPVIIDNLPPAAPTGLIAVDGGALVQVNWDANLEPDLLGYLLYRGGELIGYGSALPADLRPLAIATNAHTDAVAPDGELAYRVYAIDRAGNISPASAPATLVRDAGPPKLKILRPQAGQAFEDAIEIVAQSSDRDIAQVVFSFRSIGAADWTTLGAPVTQLPWRSTFDPVNLAYGEYELRAVATDRGGLSDPEPPIVSVRYADLTPPRAPTQLRARADGVDVRLSWALGTDSDLSGYRVERQAASGVWESLQPALGPVTEFVDGGRTLGEHRYRVVAVDSSDNASAPSVVESAHVFDLTLAQPFTPVERATATLRGSASSRGGRVEYRVTSDSQSASGQGATVAAHGAFTLADVPLFIGANDVSVRLRDESDNLSIPAVVSLLRGEIPLPPTAVTGTLVANNVTLTWHPSTSGDVTGYRVHRNGRVLGLDTRVAQTIRAQGANGEVPAVVDQDVESAWTIAAPAASATLSYPGQLTLSWDQPALVSGIRLRFADAQRSVSDYRVSMLDPVAGWIAVGERSARAGTEEVFLLDTPYPTRSIRIELQRAQAPGATVSVLEIEPLQRHLVAAPPYDDTVTDGRHAYAVSAVSALGFESALSAPWTVEVGDVTAPPTPTLTGSIQAGVPTLEWTESAAADLLGYVIYRDGARIAQVPAAQARTYADPGLPNGRYVYAVKAHDQHFNESPRSNDVTLDLAAQVPGVPSIVSVQQAGEAPALRISWTPGAGAAPASYRLFVSAAENDPALPYALLLTLPGVEYLHQGLERGRRYWYRVQALDANGNAGGLSAPASGETRDVVAPLTPRLFWPTVPGVPITSTSTTFDVCGVTSPGANVLLARNGVALSEVRANADGLVRRLPFALRGLDVLLAPDGDSVFLPGPAGGSNPGWFAVRDGTRTESVDRSSYSVSLARYSPDRGRVTAVAADGRSLFSFRRDDSYVPQRSVGGLGTVRDLAPHASEGGHLLLIERPDQAMQLYRGNQDFWNAQYVQIALPAGRTPARGSLAWAADTQDALFADTEGRVYRHRRGAAAAVDIGAGATAAGPLPAPHDISVWLAVERATARVLRFDADGQPPRVLLDDGRLPLAVAWISNGLEVALRFSDRLEIRDAVTGALLRASAQTVLDPVPTYRLQWVRGGRLLLTSSASGWAPELIDLAGAFCAPGIAAVPGMNRIEAVAENASGLLSLPSDPIEIDHPLGTPDLVLDERDLRFFPAGAQLNEQRIAYIEVRNEGDRYARSEAGVYLRATLRLPDGTERVVERDGVFQVGADATESVALDLGRLPQLGEYRLHVALDPEYRIAESDEGNNAVSVSWRVGSTAVPDLSLVTQRTLYAAGNRVDGTFSVFNPGSTFTGTVTLEARDAAGAAVGEIGRYAVPALAYGQTRREEWNWATSLGLVDGEYQILAQLRDERGTLVVERSVRITLESDVDLALLLQPQSTRAVMGQPLPVHFGIDYLGGSRVLEHGTLRLTARDAAGNERVLWSGTSGVLLSGYSVRRSIEWPAAAQSLGAHELRLDFASGNLSRSTKRDVEFVPATDVAPIRGSVSIAPARQLALGAPATLQVQVENPGATALTATQVRVRVIAEGEAAARLEQAWSTDLAPAARMTQVVDLAELTDTPALFVARLEARLTGDAVGVWRTLATAGFAAVDGEAPQIRLITPDALTPRRSPTPIAVRISDRHTRVERASYRVDGGEWRALSAGGIDGYEGLMHGLADGAHVLAVRARDGWNNEAVSEGHSFVVDSTPPSIVIGGVSDSDRRNVPVTPTISVADAHPDGYSAWLDDAPHVAGTAIDAEGAHRLYVISTDLAGNRSDRMLSFTLDYTPPALAIVNPVDGATTTLDAIVVRVASEAGSKIVLDVGGFHAEAVADANGQALFAAVPLVTGSNRIEARATDAAQNAATPAVVLVTRRVASGEISGQLLGPVEVARGQGLSLQLRIENGTATDYPALPLRLTAFAAGGSAIHSQSVQANVPAGATVTLAQTLDTATWPWGPTALVLESDLGTGYRTLDSATVTVIDAQAPQIVTLEPGPDSVQPRAVQLALLATDDRAVVAADYRIDDGAWSVLTQDGQGAESYVGLIELPDGAHTVRFRARDAADNVATSSGINFVVDGTPPQIAISGVADGETYARPVTPVVEMLDANPGTLTLLLDDAPFSSGTEVSANGVHVLRARANDAAGNHSERTVRFMIDREPPAVTFLQPRDGDIVVAEQLLVVGQTEPSAEVRVNLAGFAAIVIANAQGIFNVPNVPLAEGENLLTATATDVAGNQGVPASLRAFRSAAGPAGVSGSLTVMPRLVPMGETFSLGMEVVERAGNARAALPLRLELRAASSPAALWARDRTAALTAGQTYTTSEVVESRDLPQGDYIATLRTQHEGVWYELAAVSLEVVDGVAPVVTLLAPAAHSVHRDEVETRVSVTDQSAIEGVQARIEGGEWQSMTALGGGEWRHALALPREGELIIQTRARDSRGNTSVAVAVPVRSDRSPPVIVVAGVTDGQRSRLALTPRIEVEDASVVEVTTTLDGAGYVSGTPVAADGEHLLVVLAEDVVGHRSERRVAFVIDSTAPLLTIIQPQAGALVTSPSIDVLGRTEPHAQVRLEAEGVVREVQADDAGSFVVIAFPLRNGTNVLRARASDAAGNVGAWVELALLRTCGTVDLACSIFSDGFEGSAGGGIDRQRAVDSSKGAGVINAEAVLIPTLRPGALLLAILLLLGAGMFAYQPTRTK